VKYGISIKHVLPDNHSLGKISKEQLAADFPVWHTSLHNPDWAAYAALCGATGIKADRRRPARPGHDPAIRRRRPRHAARHPGSRTPVTSRQR
jgi:thiamine pyrophosphate-dependent acetolactate synthase large subunit-like protein